MGFIERLLRRPSLFTEGGRTYWLSPARVATFVPKDVV